MTLLFDPPSGWMYGFPLPVEAGDDIEALLRKQGYPEKDIPFALEHSRYTSTREELIK